MCVCVCVCLAWSVWVLLGVMWPRSRFQRSEAVLMERTLPSAFRGVCGNGRKQWSPKWRLDWALRLLDWDWALRLLDWALRLLDWDWALRLLDWALRLLDWDWAL